MMRLYETRMFETSSLQLIWNICEKVTKWCTQNAIGAGNVNTIIFWINSKTKNLLEKKHSNVRKITMI